MDLNNELVCNGNKNQHKVPSILHSHATTWHDGGVAALREDGKIYALSSERVGDRYKHSWNSRLAYDYLIDAVLDRALDYDKFFDTREGLEDTGHHFYHAASTFYGSGYPEAAVLVVDGQGPENTYKASSSIWLGKDDELHLLEMPHLAEGKFAPCSLGHFYTAIGALAGMQEMHEEGKTMGLASYGKPSKYLDFFRQYVYTNRDGSYDVNQDFIFATLGNTLGKTHYGWDSQPTEIQAIWEKFMKLRGTPIRQKGEAVTQDDADIAYAGQTILEEVMLAQAKRAFELTRSDNLCLAGGVALNSVANGKIMRSGLFKDVFIFPAAGDDGQAIGKLFADIKQRKLPIKTTVSTAYYGPGF